MALPYTELLGSDLGTQVKDKVNSLGRKRAYGEVNGAALQASDVVVGNIDTDTTTVVLLDTSAAARNCTIPSITNGPNGNNQNRTLWVAAVGANTVTISGGGNINGAANKVLAANQATLLIGVSATDGWRSLFTGAF